MLVCVCIIYQCVCVFRYMYIHGRSIPVDTDVIYLLCICVGTAEERPRVDSDILIITLVTSTRVKEYKKSVFFLAFSLLYLPALQKVTGPLYSLRATAWELRSVSICMWVPVYTDMKLYYYVEETHTHAEKKKEYNSVERKSPNHRALLLDGPRPVLFFSDLSLVSSSSFGRRNAVCMLIGRIGSSRTGGADVTRTTCRFYCVFSCARPLWSAPESLYIHYTVTQIPRLYVYPSYHAGAPVL